MILDNYRILKTVLHEFRTPLNTINSISNMLIEEDLNPNIKKKLELIKQSCVQIDNTINGIIELHKEDDNFIENLRKIDIYTLVKKSAAIYAMNTNKNSILYENLVAEDLTLYGNKAYLDLFVNTIINVFLYYNKNETINIKTELISQSLEHSVIQFKINDSKKEINENIRHFFSSPSIFQETDANSSLDLSSALFRKYLNICNGELIEYNIDNKSYENLVFHLSFQHEHISRNNGIGKLKKAYNLLIVEDNKVNQLLAISILSKKGFLCTAANNGVEAVRAARENDFDIVFMDLMMPIMNGHDAAKIIKSEKPNTIIIALSAVAELEETNNEDDAFDAYLKKPYEIESLIDTVKNILHDNALN